MAANPISSHSTNINYYQPPKLAPTQRRPPEALQFQQQQHSYKIVTSNTSKATATTKTTSLSPSRPPTVTSTTKPKTNMLNNSMAAQSAYHRFFSGVDDVTVSESTDITDVTAKSHSVNSYSTSMQAEIGSGRFGSNSINSAALNPFRYQRHINLDTCIN